VSRNHRVRQSDGEHRLRPQRTPPATTVDTLMDAPANPKPYYERSGRYLPGQLGRFPTVGLDEGCVKNTRPDTSPINQR
jgi:hypothetical protein